jgi:hypothetical protein
VINIGTLVCTVRRSFYRPLSKGHCCPGEASITNHLSTLAWSAPSQRGISISQCVSDAGDIRHESHRWISQRVERNRSHAARSPVVGPESVTRGNSRDVTPDLIRFNTIMRIDISIDVRACQIPRGAIMANHTQERVEGKSECKLPTNTGGITECGCSITGAV